LINNFQFPLSRELTYYESSFIDFLDTAPSNLLSINMREGVRTSCTTYPLAQQLTKTFKERLFSIPTDGYNNDWIWIVNNYFCKILKSENKQL